MSFEAIDLNTSSDAVINETKDENENQVVVKRDLTDVLFDDEDLLSDSDDENSDEEDLLQNQNNPSNHKENAEITKNTLNNEEIDDNESKLPIVFATKQKLVLCELHKSISFLISILKTSLHFSFFLQTNKKEFYKMKLFVVRFR